MRESGLLDLDIWDIAPMKSGKCGRPRPLPANMEGTSLHNLAHFVRYTFERPEMASSSVVRATESQEGHILAPFGYIWNGVINT